MSSFWSFGEHLLESGQAQQVESCQLYLTFIIFGYITTSNFHKSFKYVHSIITVGYAGGNV